VLVAIQENEFFQDAFQGESQDSIQDVSSEIPQGVPQDELSIVDNDSIPSMESYASDMEDLVEEDQIHRELYIKDQFYEPYTIHSKILLNHMA
jgi:hypothetical protein